MARYHFAKHFKGDKMQMMDHWIDSLGNFHLKEIDVLGKDKRIFFFEESGFGMKMDKQQFNFKLLTLLLVLP